MDSMGGRSIGRIERDGISQAKPADVKKDDVTIILFIFAQARNEHLNTVRAEIERVSRYHHRR
ncbi:hypothetical protein FG060_03660 [Vibrio cholerae]|nr:hypothetical protein [Vibrio cholerae]EGR0602524.1 hypothetical protein [Vibrio cholerae]